MGKIAAMEARVTTNSVNLLSLLHVLDSESMENIATILCKVLIVTCQKRGRLDPVLPDAIERRCEV